MTIRSFQNRVTNATATVRTGYTGSLGYTGSVGTGFTGSTGDIGYTGSQGIIGYTGSGVDPNIVVTLTGTQTLTNKTVTSLNGNSTIADSSGLNSYSIGYKQVPQNTQNAAYTLVNSDDGKHIYYTGGSATITIPMDGSTSGGNFAIGASMAIINHGSGTLTISHAGSLFLAGNTTSASRSLSAKGIASIIKVASNTWYISGGGIT